MSLPWVTHHDGKLAGGARIQILLPRVETIVQRVRFVPHESGFEHKAAFARLLKHGHVDVEVGVWKREFGQ